MSTRPIVLAVALTLAFCTNCAIAGEPAGEKAIEKPSTPHNVIAPAQVQIDMVIAHIEDGPTTRKGEAAYERWGKLSARAHFKQMGSAVFYMPGQHFCVLESDKNWMGCLRALRRHGLARLIAEPKLVTMTDRPVCMSIGSDPSLDAPAPAGALGFKCLCSYFRFTVTASFKADQICLKSKIEMAEPTSLYLDNGNSCSYRAVNVVSTNCTLKEGTTLMIVVPATPSRPARPWWVEYLREIPEVGDLIADTLAGKEPFAETAIFITPHLVNPSDLRQMAN
jgi:Flp pilus assembly secretin CpaC